MSDQREILNSFPLIEVTDVWTIAIQQVEKHGLLGITRIKFINSKGEAILFVRAYATNEHLPVIDILPGIKEEIK